VLKFLSSLLMLFCSMQSLADARDNWIARGFLTQGINYTSDHAFYGDSDDGISTDFSEAGINLSKFFTNDIRFTTQFAYRNSNTLDRNEFFLDLLQLDITLNHTNTTTTGIQIGRIKPHWDLYNDNYDVSAAWPSATLPEVFYPQLSRSILLNFEGINLYTQIEMENRTYHLNIGAGQRKVNKEVVEDALLLNFADSEDTDAKDLFSVLLDSTNNNNRWGLSYVYARWSPELNFNDQAATKVQTSAYTLSAYFSQHWAQWQLISEISRSKQSSSSKPIAYPNGPAACTPTCQFLADSVDQIFNSSSHSYSGYISLYRHFSSGFNFYIGYGHSISNSDDRRGKKFEAITGLPHHTRYLKQSYMGLQHQINEKWSIATDINFFEGTSNLSNKQNGKFLSRKKYWHSIFARISYAF
jgi:hypothetical protein